MMQIDELSFDTEVLQSDQLVLVDFWAPWCGPCRMIAPILDEMAQELDIKIVKLNTDENPNLATQYGIRSIPTLMLFRKGQRLDTVIGAVPKSTLMNTIAKYL
nr:thioredoxin [Cyanidioschyzonaceae sp. 1]